MIDEVVVDAEIVYQVNGPEGLTWEDTDKLGVSVAVIYEFRTDRFRIYGPQDLTGLRERLLKAERVTG